MSNEVAQFQSGGVAEFQGATFEPQHDGLRLKGQLDRVRMVMLHSSLTEEWLTLAEIAKFAGGSEAGCSARLRDLRKARFGGYIVERRRRGQPARGLFEYRVAGKVL